MWPKHWYTVGSEPLVKLLFTPLKDFLVTNKKERLTKEEMNCIIVFVELDFFLTFYKFSRLSPVNIGRPHTLKAVRPEKII